MKPVVVFGNGRLASLAYFYLTHDSEREVAAFTVVRDYVTADTLFGLPVVPADEVLVRFPPDHFDISWPWDTHGSTSFARANTYRRRRWATS